MHCHRNSSTDKEEALELYKVMVSTITSSEQQRQQAATIYLSLLVTSATALGAFQSLKAIYIAFPSLAISIIWVSSIGYFKRLAKAKFAVIEELENKFTYQPFMVEWERFKQLKNKKIIPRLGLAHLEMIIPSFVAASSMAYIIYWVLPYICAILR